MLPASDTHVWHIDLDALSPEADSLSAVLSQDELSRAARFHFDSGRRRYIVARHALRAILARQLGCDPRSLAFAYTQHGKPYLPDTGVQFNLSHSANRAVVAVSLNRQLGVDIERVRADRDLVSLAARFFAPAERAFIEGSPANERPAAFYRCWTRKEAYLKARGDGLSLGLDSFAVSMSGDSPSFLTASDFGQPEIDRWQFLDFPCPSSFATSLAIENGPVALQIHQFEVAR